MPRLRFFVTVSLVLGARLDIPQHATAQPSEKKPRDVAKANVLGRQFSVFRHPAYAVVAPAATLRVWIDVENSGGLDDLRFEYTVAGKPAAQQAIRLDRKAANRYQGVVAFDLEPLKLSLKHTLSLTVVTGKLRPRPLQFTLAHPDTVFDNLAKGHKSNRNEVRVLVGRLESLGKTLQTLHNSVAAGNAVKRSTACIAPARKSPT